MGILEIAVISKIYNHHHNAQQRLPSGNYKDKRQYPFMSRGSEWNPPQSGS
jgi:hypothetical protein